MDFMNRRVENDMSIVEKEIGNMDVSGISGVDSTLKETQTNWELQDVSVLMKNSEPSKYMTSLSAYELADMEENYLLRYNPNTQRGLRIVRGEEKPITNITKIRQIYNEMSKYSLNGGTITLNYLQTDEEKDNPTIKYDSDNRVLFGEKSLDILDGMHRIQSCRLWKKNWDKSKKKVMPDPNLYRYNVVIEVLDEFQASNLFAEYSLMPTKISKTRSEFLNVKSFSNTIIRNLMNDPNSILLDKIETISTGLKGKNDKIATFSTLSSAIDQNFSPLNREQANDISKFLIKAFNQIGEFWPQHFGSVDYQTRQALRKESMVIEPLMFYGWISLFAKIYDRQDWRDILYKLKDDIEVNGWKGNITSKSNPMWESIFRTKGQDKLIINNSSTQKTISKLFVEKLINVE